MLKKSLLDAIGNTPLVPVNLKTSANVYTKLEYFNPGGSIKDRAASYIIKEAERTGKLKAGDTLIDASSGNLGIAVAMIGALKGHKVIITVTEKISQEKLQTIQAYGAHVVMCPPTNFIDDPESYYSQAAALHKNTPHSFMLNQYFNPLNPIAHYTGLGPEIWEQTQGQITHFFAGAGSGGTISGAGKYLKEKNPDIKVIAIDSVNSYRATQGNPKSYQVEGIGIDFDSPVLDYSVIDDIVTVSDEDAFSMLKQLARTGFLAGLSSGAVAHATQEYSKGLSKNNLAIMIFGDSGRAYLTKGVY